MPYRIDPGFRDPIMGSHKLTIEVVGCGGTGGFVAEGLCRLLPHDMTLILIDHDRVEEHNLRRQLFYPQDLGKFKSQALAERLARLYGREVGYSVYPFQAERDDRWSTLIIGCVDNAAARNAIHRGTNCWWVDAGNGQNSGQVLVGNVRAKAQCKGLFIQDKGVWRGLPSPAIQMPELLIPVPGELNPQGCAERVEAAEQSPVINQMMAGLVLEVVRRLLAGTLTWMGITLDLELGIMRPIEADPKIVARMAGLNINQVVVQSSERR